MKKILLSLILLVTALSAYADKAIYYPFYRIDVEVYHADTLYMKDTIFHEKIYSLPMLQEGCQIIVTTPEDIIPHIKASISNRQMSNFSMATSAVATVASVVSTVKAANARTNLSSSMYLIQSAYFDNIAERGIGLMLRFKENAEGSLVLPVDCIINNSSDKILRSNVILKPNESICINPSYYCDEYRITDNYDNVYCIKVAACVIRDKGFMSRQLGVAFAHPTKEEEKEGHKGQYLKINLKTYETEWVDLSDRVFQVVRTKYANDNGHNESIEPSELEFDDAGYLIEKE